VYLLDFGTCLLLLEGGSQAVAGRLRGQRPSHIAISSMAKAQLLARARGGERVEARLETLRRFLEPVTTLPFDDRCAEEYGQILAVLTSQGEAMAPEDLVNAATARANDAVLITPGTARFSPVAGLRLDDWRESGEPAPQR